MNSESNFSTFMKKAGYCFNKHLGGVCAVENGEILHGPPRQVKVSFQDPDALAPRWCCCVPRKPRLSKVAKFSFAKHKNEAVLQKHTSLETAMKMDGMVFQEYWTPGRALVKVSVKQRRGKKVVLFGRLATFLDQMRDRLTDQFVLYVTETSFRIITKDRIASGDEETEKCQKEMKEAIEEKEECDKVRNDETKVNIDYMTSLINSFKRKEPAQMLTPEVMKLPPVMPTFAVPSKNVASCNYWLYKEPLAARRQQSIISREMQPARKRKDLSSAVQMVEVKRKNTSKRETTAWGEYEENETEKEDSNTKDVKNAALEEREAETETVMSFPAQEENTDKKCRERQGKEQNTGMIRLLQESDNDDIHDTDEEETDGKEVNSVPPEAENTEAWEDCDEYESGMEEASEDLKKNVDKEDKEDGEGECDSMKDREPGIVKNVQLVQKVDDEDTESEEEECNHESEKEETNTEEGNSVPPEEDVTEAWEGHEDHDTGKEKPDAEEVNSVPVEKEATDEEEEGDFEKDVGKEDVTEKVVNIPCSSKVICSSEVSVKSRTRRKRTRKRKRVSPDYKKTVSGNVSSKCKCRRRSTSVKKRCLRRNAAKGHNLKENVLKCSPKRAMMGNVSSRWRWRGTSSPTRVNKVTWKKKVKKIVVLKKKSLQCSQQRNVFRLKRKRRASLENKKLNKRVNLQRVRCKVECHSNLPSNDTPELDVSLLESQAPPSGPARVRWARKVAALKARLRARKPC